MKSNHFCQGSESITKNLMDVNKLIESFITGLYDTDCYNNINNNQLTFIRTV